MSTSREDRIRTRAEELYRIRGEGLGSALEDWLRAEKEVLEAGIDERLDETFPASDPPARPIPVGSEGKQSKFAKAK